MEGVLVTGTAEAGLEGECARCLEPIEDTVHVDLQELFVYDDPGHTATDDDEDDDVSRLEGRSDRPRATAAGCGGARTAVPAAVPGRLPGPVHRVWCAARGRPGHRHDEPVDPRWAALSNVVVAPGRGTTRRPPARPTRVVPDPRSNRGCPEAEDVAQQHATPSFCVEGRRALARDLRQPGLRREAPAAPCLPRVRPVRREGRPSSGPLTRGPCVAGIGVAADATNCVTRSAIRLWIPSCCSLP